MRGKIVAINRTNGMFVVAVGDGSYTVAELLGGHDIALEQRVTGNLQDHGGERIRNVDGGEIMDCYIQGYDLTYHDALDLIR